MSENNGQGERNGHGRFVKGHSGGPGRPKRVVEEDYLRSLTQEVPMGEWKKIAARAVEDAKKGDARAREWLSNYLIGKVRDVGVMEGETIVKIVMEGLGPLIDEGRFKDVELAELGRRLAESATRWAEKVSQTP